MDSEENHLLHSLLEQCAEQPGALDSYVIAATVDMARTEIRRLAAEVLALRTENERLREALAFYAQTDNWHAHILQPHVRSRAAADAGIKARAALQYERAGKGGE